MNEKVYTEEAVNEALRLTAMGVAGILHQKDAKESLEKLPKDLQEKVMAATVAAHSVRDLVLSLIPKNPEEREKEEKEEREGEREFLEILKKLTNKR